MKTMATTKLVFSVLLLLPLASTISAHQFCVAKSGISDQVLQTNINYACVQPGVDCSAIQPGGSCFTGDLSTRASYAMNAYYNVFSSKGATCDFIQSAQLTSTDPSHGACKYISQTGGGSSVPKPTQPTTPSSPGSSATPAAPSTGGSGGNHWCVPKPGATNQALQDNINWLCGTNKVDCSAINGGGKCYAQAFLPRASYIMDLYYKKNGRHSYDCDFKGSAHLTTINPSWGNCIYGS